MVGVLARIVGGMGAGLDQRAQALGGHHHPRVVAERLGEPGLDCARERLGAQARAADEVAAGQEGLHLLERQLRERA